MPPRPSAAELPSSEARVWAAMMHLAGFGSYLLPVPGAGVVLPLVLWLVRRDEGAFEESQGRAAVNFQLLCAALYLGSLMLVPLLVGIPLVFVVVVLHVVATLVATVVAASGRPAAYPVSLGLVGPDTLR